MNYSGVTFGHVSDTPRLSNAVRHRVFAMIEGHTHPVTCRTTGVYLKHAKVCGKMFYSPALG